MVKSARLYQILLASPGQFIAFRDFEKLVRAFGFTYDRTSGSHMIYCHPLVPRPFPIQPEGKHAKRYQVRELLELIETYGLHINE